MVIWLHISCVQPRGSVLCHSAGWGGGGGVDKHKTQPIDVKSLETCASDTVAQDFVMCKNIESVLIDLY